MNKVIVVGWDGVPPDIAFGLWKEDLPNLKRIVDKGSHGELESVIPYITAAAWTSFATGQNPGKTGIFNFLLPKENLSDIRPINSRDIKTPTIFELLEKKDKKSILINLPVSHPPKTNNITITSFLTQSDDYIYPINLKEKYPELAKYKIIPSAEAMTQPDIEKLAIECRAVEKTRFETAKLLFEKEPWELFFILFSASDTIQHKAHCKIMAGKIGDDSNVKQLFKDLDKYLGWFLDNMSADTTLILMSDHGFKCYKGFFSINRYLAEKGYLTLTTKSNKVNLTRGAKERAELMQNKGKSFRSPLLMKLAYSNPLTLKISKAAYKLLRRFKKIKIESGLHVDANSSKAVFPKGGFQELYINHKDRFKSGIVEGHLLRNRLAAELRAMKDPEGNKLFEAVYTKEDLYFGACIDKAPDILMSHNNYLISYDPAARLFAKTEMQGHKRAGIFAMIGKGIEPSKINASIIDIAPTICSIMGIKANFDGKTIGTIKRLKEDWNELKI